MEAQTDILSEFAALKINRRQLLPRWIKMFCWIFMFTGSVGLFCLIVGLFGQQASLSMYGFETNEPFSFLGLMITALMILKGITAFYLWFEKNEAIILGKADALIGIVLCFISMALPAFSESFHFTVRFELVLLIPFFVKLH